MGSIGAKKNGLTSVKTAAGPGRVVAVALPVLAYFKYAALRFSPRLARRAPRSFSRLGGKPEVVALADPSL